MKCVHDLIVLSLAACLVAGPLPVHAAPRGGKVAAGSASIGQSGSTTTIDQSSNRAVINWQSFDIGKNETVRHNMPSADAAALHRVVGGGGASQLKGALTSNGNIYLVNPAGVVINKGARINTNSFMATSRDISNDNFMRGKMVFDTPGRPDARVINEGTITVGEKGLAALVAPTVRNDGAIAGKLAKVTLASGNAAYTLDMYGDNLITFAVSDTDVNGLYAADGTPLSDNAVTNGGTIKTDGGVVVLTSSQLDGIVGSVVNTGGVEAGEVNFIGQGSKVNVTHSGTVSVASATGNGGVVRMDTDGDLTVSGSIDATGAGKGGSVTLTGETVALKEGASVNASGATGGGTVLVGGNALGKGPERNAKTTSVAANTTIKADATHKGDGGQVVVWSDGKTTFDGGITALGGKQGGNGGKVETSGKTLKIGGNAYVSTSAPKGSAGWWLLDPEDVIIGGQNSTLSAATLSEMLQHTGVQINAGFLLTPDDMEQVGTSGYGDIIINEEVIVGNHLVLFAERNIEINALISGGENPNQYLTMTYNNELTGTNNIQGDQISSGTSSDGAHSAIYALKSFQSDQKPGGSGGDSGGGSGGDSGDSSWDDGDDSGDGSWDDGDDSGDGSWDDSDCDPDSGSKPDPSDSAFDPKTIEDKQQNVAVGSNIFRDNWLSRDRERGGDELSQLVDGFSVDVEASTSLSFAEKSESAGASPDTSDGNTKDDSERGKGVNIDAGDAAAAANFDLAAYYHEQAKASMKAAKELINRDQSSMSEEKRIAAIENLIEGRMNLVAYLALFNRGGQAKDTGLSDAVESVMAEVPQVGKMLLQQTFSGGADSPVIPHAADSGVDERVVASLNRALGGVFNAIARAGAGRGGDFIANASDTVREALQNDEQLQRYIDLYNYYVTEKMSLAGAIMG